MLSIRMIRPLLTWSLAIFFAAQALVISILYLIDAWRKRYRVHVLHR